MNITFTAQAWSEYLTWADDRTMLRRVNRLLNQAARDPSSGIGKPEPLSQNLSGHWSRRITQEHRLVYRVEGEALIVIQCRYHY